MSYGYFLTPIAQLDTVLVQQLKDMSGIMISGALSISDGNWRTFSPFFNLLSTIFYFENLKISGFVSNYEQYGDSSHSKRHLFSAETKIFNDNYD